MIILSFCGSGSKMVAQFSSAASLYKNPFLHRNCFPCNHVWWWLLFLCFCLRLKTKNRDQESPPAWYHCCHSLPVALWPCRYGICASSRLIIFLSPRPSRCHASLQRTLEPSCLQLLPVSHDYPFSHDSTHTQASVFCFRYHGLKPHYFLKQTQLLFYLLNCSFTHSFVSLLPNFITHHSFPSYL